MPPQLVGGLGRQAGSPLLPSSLAPGLASAPPQRPGGPGWQPQLPPGLTPSLPPLHIGGLGWQAGSPLLPPSLTVAGGPGGSSGFWSTPSGLAHNAFSAPSQPRAGGSGDVAYSYNHAGPASSAFPLSLSSTSRDRSVSGAMVPPLSLTVGSLPSSMPCSSGLEWNSSSARSEPLYSSLPAIDGGQAGLSTPRREPCRPWVQPTQPISPPHNEDSVVDSGAPVGADSEPLDPDSLPSLLRFLGGVDLAYPADILVCCGTFLPLI